MVSPMAPVVQVRMLRLRQAKDPAQCPSACWWVPVLRHKLSSVSILIFLHTCMPNEKAFLKSKVEVVIRCRQCKAGTGACSGGAVGKHALVYLPVLSILRVPGPARMLKRTRSNSCLCEAGSQDPLHHLQGSVQRKRAGPLVKKPLRFIDPCS